MGMTMTQKILAAHAIGRAGCPHPAAITVLSGDGA